MCSETTKERKDEGGKAGLDCRPEKFQEMFSAMSGCCADRDNLLDWAELMSRMKAGCCGPSSRVSSSRSQAIAAKIPYIC
jgi:hypothetical protein